MYIGDDLRVAVYFNLLTKKAYSFTVQPTAHVLRMNSDM
jgi:hypothetical protein